MTNLTTDDLKALLAAATPGPWDVFLWHRADKLEIWDVTADTTTVAECHWCHDDAVAADVVRANARLIALAPALAEEVIRLRARAALVDEADE